MHENNSRTSASLSPAPTGIARVLSLRRLGFTFAAICFVTLILSASWKSPILGLLTRVLFIGFMSLIVFGVFETWPRTIPRGLARWALQVAGVAIAIPIIVFALYVVTTGDGQLPFWRTPDRLRGFGMLLFAGILFAPWIAMVALIRQGEAKVQHLALAFDLERSELARQALDARLKLLQAQVEPHFLFNTLANVRQLVDAGSPQAPAVLDSLIAYLRAAVPRLHEPSTNMAQELALVRAYLELMQLRMPDRLQFSLHADDTANTLACPPMTLLTLVENAVRHGIDPAEDGGRIDIRVTVRSGRCIAQVIDSGVGLKHAGRDTGMGLGTGLSSLRERLTLAFGKEAQLRITESVPHGVCAEIEFPATVATV